jgi:hypothetical protein
VEICGDLGLQFDAKDSAFDGCALHKTGAWFVDAFSTQWRFENCVDLARVYREDLRGRRLRRAREQMHVLQYDASEDGL